MKKKCTKCGEVKSLDEFSNDKRLKSGKQSKCKNCDNEYYQNNIKKIKLKHKEYYIKNKEEICERVKKWAENNQEKVSLYRKNYGKINSEKLKEYNKKYQLENREKLKEYYKKYYKKNDSKIKDNVKKYKLENREKSKEYYKKHYQNNKEEINKKNKEYQKKNKERMNKHRRIRQLNDPLFKLRCALSSNICCSLKRQGYSKETKTYDILKCEYDFFMTWLNGVASNGYTYGIGDLQLDHVIPISLAETEDESYLLNHYSNFQLLSADENLTKGNRYVNPLNLARVLEHHPNPDKIREIHSRL